MILKELKLELKLQDIDAAFEVNGEKIKFFSLYESLKKFLLPKHEETTKGAIIESISSQIADLKKDNKGIKRHI